MNKMKTLILIAAIAMGAACGAKTSTAGANDKPGAPKNEPKTDAKTDAKQSPASAGGAADAVKKVYELALKRDCAAIPPLLAEDFRNAVGTSRESLDALCDELTDSGRLASVEIVREEPKGDAATVTIARVDKNGKRAEKQETLKKSGDRWLLGS